MVKLLLVENCLPLLNTELLFVGAISDDLLSRRS